MKATRPALQTGQAGAETMVDPVSEREATAVVAADIEGLRIPVAVVVAVTAANETITCA